MIEGKTYFHLCAVSLQAVSGHGSPRFSVLCTPELMVSFLLCRLTTALPSIYSYSLGRLYIDLLCTLAFMLSFALDISTLSF